MLLVLEPGDKAAGFNQPHGEEAAPWAGPPLPLCKPRPVWFRIWRRASRMTETRQGTAGWLMAPGRVLLWFKEVCTFSIPHAVAWTTHSIWFIPRTLLLPGSPFLPLLPSPPAPHLSPRSLVPTSLYSQGNAIMRPQTTLACLFSPCAHVATPRPGKTFHQDGQGGCGGARGRGQR